MTGFHKHKLLVPVGPQRYLGKIILLKPLVRKISWEETHQATKKPLEKLVRLHNFNLAKTDASKLCLCFFNLALRKSGCLVPSVLEGCLTPALGNIHFTAVCHPVFLVYTACLR